MCIVQPGDVVTCHGDDFLVPAITKKGVVPDGIPFMAVTVGDTFSCGLVTNGSAVCWGEFPGAAPNPATTFIDIHAGANNLCGLQAAGAVLCYGNDTAGVITTLPVGVYQGGSTGTDTAGGVTRDHTAACWGNTTDPGIATMPAITDAEHVSVGATHACYITTSGGLVCWGDNDAGQTTVPASVNSNSAVWWVSAGGSATCAISGSSAADMTPPGRLECWGEATGTWNSTRVYEVACAAWGCIVSEDAGGGAAKSSIAAASMSSVPFPRVYNSTTFAGSGMSGSADGIGTNAEFDVPRGLSIRDGALVVSTTGYYFGHTIRRVNLTTANVTTLAGQPGDNTGVDAANPYSATFGSPHSLEYNAAGDLYVSDWGTCLLRKISAAGAVTTIAGTRDVDSPPTDGVGTNAIVGSVYDMRYDGTSGIMYFTDLANNRVRALYPNETVGTIADIGCCYLQSLVLDTEQRVIYVGGDAGIFKVHYDGTFTLFSGSNNNDYGFADGIATVARFDTIHSIERDAAGNLYAVDGYNCTW